MLDKENIFSRGKKLCEYGLVKGTRRGGGGGRKGCGDWKRKQIYKKQVHILNVLCRMYIMYLIISVSVTTRIQSHGEGKRNDFPLAFP